MKYFSGFSLQNEEKLFEEYINFNNYCVAGFSYGAQRALEYVYHTDERIDKLILLSPAFFHIQKPSFIRAQLHYFKVEQEAYLKQFFSNVAYPSNIKLSTYQKKDTIDTLTSLLNYKWDQKKLEKIIQRGTSIEIFIGLKDKIIDANEVASFFSIGTTYLLKDVGHLLQGASS